MDAVKCAGTLRVSAFGATVYQGTVTLTIVAPRLCIVVNVPTTLTRSAWSSWITNCWVVEPSAAGAAIPAATATAARAPEHRLSRGII